MGSGPGPAVVAAAAAAAGYAWLVAGLRPFTAAALVATLAGGLAAIAVGARLAPTPAGPIRGPRPGSGRWALAAAAALLWQMQAFVQQPRSDHPTLSSLTNVLLADRPSRAAAVLAWLAAGVWLARR